MKPKIFVVILICGMMMNLFAAPVNQETAARVAANFYYERSQGQSLIISGTQTLEQGSVVLLYIFNGLPDQGFVMVSADDRIMPVPGYALKGNYDGTTELQSPGFLALLDHYTWQILHHINHSLPATPEAILQWPKYNVDHSLFNPSSITAVAPLLGTIAWGQGCYYNADCPYDVAAGSYYCNRVPVGCVATSMVQVMKYWEYPPQGFGSGSYMHGVYGSQSANFGATNYLWTAMPDQVTAAHPGVAQASYHAGVAVQMDYGPTGSGAYTSDARNALVNNFGFKSSAVFQMQNNTPQALWESYLTGDMDLGRPVIYRGNNSVGADGHAWVIDGYQGALNNHFHCNWGWDGYHNGYFYLAALTPTTYNFSFQQGAIFGIEPQVTQKPVADFSATPTSVAVGSPVQFTSLTTGTVSGYMWYFGDGDSSGAHNPTHIYNTTGQFTVTLLAWNSAGTDTMTKANYVQVVIPPVPVADFSAQPLVLPMGDTVYFNDLTTNFPTSWHWDFGDGQSSNLQNPFHVYTTIDTFSVKLVVANAAGADSILKTNFIITTPAPPQALFTANPTIAYPGDTIFFSDLSMLSPDAWLWDFGDGDTSHAQNPWHVYALAGAFSVSLQVTNSYGSSSDLRPFYIYILPKPPLPMAWFASDVTTILTGEQVTFTDYSFVQPFQWEWSFPGGIPSSSAHQHPAPVIYPAHGSYDVQLVVWNVTGSDTLLRKDFITVGTLGMDAEVSRSVMIYPQPADKMIYISGVPGGVKACILYDLSGKVILTRKFDSGSQNPNAVDVSNLPPGLYSIAVMTSDARYFRKVLISR